MNPEVSVVIVSWNTRDILRDCLRSVAAETRLAHEVIVVDNASRDGSAEMVADEFPGAVLIRNGDNRGFAVACNQAIRVARGRYILLLNPDTIVLDNAIGRMLAWFDAQEKSVGAAGCQVWRSDNAIQRTCFAEPHLLNMLLVETGIRRALPWRALGAPMYASWDRCSERDVDVVTGMFLMVPRRVIDEVGLLDEIFFLYSEEADWCRRMRAAGYRCVFTPVARIIHRDGGEKSASQIRARMYVQKHKSKLLYARKHYGVSGHLFAKTILFATSLGRWAALGALALVRGDAETRTRARLARDASLYHFAGREPAG